MTADVSVLVVDDDDVAVFLTERALRSSDRISDIWFAKDGVEALGIIESGRRPSALLLDINMPRMDGFEFLAAYAELPADVRAGAVVAMLTTSILEHDRRRADETGLIIAYLTKPVTADDVGELVELISDASSTAAG
ncbi:MAG: response regulator [Actinomycetota bacterium]